MTQRSPRYCAGALAFAAAAGLLGAAIGWGMQGAGAQGAGAQPAPAASAQARLTAARRGYAQAAEEWRLRITGRPGAVYAWSLRVLAAERAGRAAVADQVAAFRAHRDRMRLLGKDQGAMAARGLVPGAVVLELDYYRGEADYWDGEAAAGRLPPPMP
jgi:hypothetical protein